MTSKALNICAIALCLLAFWLTIGDSPSPDLYATWLAAEFFAAGDTAQVYPPPSPHFTMLPPEAWVALEAQRGGPDELYPYLYPPLWAAIFSWIAPAVAFDSFLQIASVANAALITAMIVLAWRAARLDIPLSLWILLAAGTMLVTFVGYMAIRQNQPQILVSFLIVLAIERTRARSTSVAGAALALAAAIKIYPALFALLWLGTRDYRAFSAFVIAGGALATASVALAGWPLHLVFLEQLQTISNSVLMTPISYNLNALMAQFTSPDSFIFVETVREAAEEGARGWHVLEKGPVWLAASNTALLIAIGGLTFAAARLDLKAQSIWLWPAAIGAVTLLSPLSWSYHYLPLFAFLPALMSGLGQRRAILWLACLILPIQVSVVPMYLYAPFAHNPAQLVGTLSMIGLTLAFALIALRNISQPVNATQTA